MLRLVKLEDRLVLDGAALTEALEQGAAEFTEDLGQIADAITEHAAALSTQISARTEGLDIVLVSDALEDQTELLRAIDSSARVVVYDAANDSPSYVLQQITQAVGESASSINSLTILSHGDAGGFQLGNQFVDASALAEQGRAWAELADVMSDAADIYIYGCNLAVLNGSGEQLVNQLSALTGANVHASDDLTGLGGDWTLEVSSSEAATSANAILDFAALGANYSGTLDDSVVIVETSAGATLDEGNSITITGEQLSSTSSESDDDELNYQVTALPEYGLLRRGNETLDLGDNFTQADINAGLITYVHDGSENFADAFQFEVTDELGGQANGGFSFDIDPVNDRPRLDLDGPDDDGRGYISFTDEQVPVSVVQPGELDLIVDPDSANLSGATINLTDILDVDQEILSIDTEGTNINAVYDQASGLITLSGIDTVENYEQVLSTLTYVNTSDNPTVFGEDENGVDACDREIRITVTDEAGATSLTSIAEVHIEPINDAPVIDLPADTFTDSDTPVLITGLTVSDVDDNGQDVCVELSVANGTIVMPNTDGLVFDEGDPVNGSATLTFTGTIAEINAAIASIEYTPDAGFTGTDTLQGVIKDLGNTGQGGPLTGTDSLNIVVNTPPEVDLNGPDEPGLNYNVVFTEDGGPIAVVDDDATINDQGDGNLVSATICLTNILDPGQERLLIDTTGTPITANYDVTTGVLTLTGNATVAQYEQVLRTLQYNNDSQNPDTTDREIKVTVNDGALESEVVTSTVQVNPVNDAPEWTVPGNQTTDEDTTLKIPGISLADIDADGEDVSVTVSVANGTLTLTQTAGLSFTTGDGTDDRQMVFTGTVAEINAALNNVCYTPDSDYSGTDRLQLFVNDMGNTGPTVETDTATVDITINNVNDVPVVDLDGPGGDQNFEAIFIEDGGPVNVVDADATIFDGDSNTLVSATICLTNILDPGDETLTIDTSGTPITANYNPATGLLSLTGNATVAQYEQVIRTLQYENASQDPNTSDRLIKVTVNDGTNESDEVFSTVEVRPVNDAPVITVPGAQTTPEDTELKVPEITVVDIDARDGELSVTVSVANGTLTLNNVAGLTFSEGDGVDDANMTFTGTIAEVNAALNELCYTPGQDFVGDDQVFLLINDQGNTGPTAERDTATIDITVTPENDPPVVDPDGPDGDRDEFEVTFIEDEGAVKVFDDDLSITDVDNGLLQSAQVTLTNPLDGTAESLEIDTTGTPIVASYDPVSGVITLTGEATVAEYEQVLRTVCYNNTSQDPNETDRIVEVVVSDGEVTSDIAISTVHVIEVNDEPEVTGPLEVTVPIGEEYVFTPDIFGIVDVDTPLEDICFIIEQLPFDGLILLDGVPLGVGDMFDHTQLADGLLTYQNTDNTSGLDTFIVNVDDKEGGVNDNNPVEIIIDDTRTPFDVDLIAGVDDPAPEEDDAMDVVDSPDLDIQLIPDPLVPDSDLYQTTIDSLDGTADELEDREIFEIPYNINEFGNGGQLLPDEVRCIKNASSMLAVLDMDGRFSAGVEDPNVRLESAQGNVLGNYNSDTPNVSSNVSSIAALGIAGEGTMADDACVNFAAGPGELAKAATGGAGDDANCAPGGPGGNEGAEPADGAAPVNNSRTESN